MAQRIATEYVNASLQLSAEEMAGFVRFLRSSMSSCKCGYSITAITRWFSRTTQDGKKSA